MPVFKYHDIITLLFQTGARTYQIGLKMTALTAGEVMASQMETMRKMLACRKRVMLFAIETRDNKLLSDVIDGRDRLVYLNLEALAPHNSKAKELIEEWDAAGTLFSKDAHISIAWLIETLNDWLDASGPRVLATVVEISSRKK